jgi:enamine deaminase RidA (YjgF/YER057c/UK114 family)
MSQGVVAAGLLHISGQVATDKSTGVEDQTRQVLAKLEDIMSEAGATKAGLVSVTVYLAHIADFAAMNSVYDRWIDTENPPARACVEARLANPGIRVEISAICAVTR